MNTSTNHKFNVNVPAGIVRGARAAALLLMDDAADLTDGPLAVRWMR
jgi:hypothetical protein